MGNMIGKSIKFEDWKGDTRMGTIVSILNNGDYEVSTDRGMALVKKAEIVKMRRGGGIPKATQMKRAKMAQGGSMYAEGGGVSKYSIDDYDIERLQEKGLTIKQMNDVLMEKFPDSFGFKLYPIKEGSSSNYRNLIPDTDNYYGIEDDSLRISFDRNHNMSYRIYQGGENTYFYFILDGSDGNGYIGSFGFKDQGDVPKEYVTSFTALLSKLYGFPFKVSHEVYAQGGGIPEYVPVSEKQNKAEVDRFIEYVNMFYGKGADALGKDGYTKTQIKTAITKYLKDLDKEYTWGYGDSLDRERVYSYLMNPEQEGINNPSFAKGGMIKAGDMVRSTKFKGYEGVVVSKGKSKEMGKNYYFVRLNETLPNGDYQHDIMWADEVEKMAKGGAVKELSFDNSNLYFYGFGKDTTGNSFVKVGFPNQKAFSIQINDPSFRNTYSLKSNKVSEISESDLNKIEKEVVSYVKDFGSAKQKASLKTYSGFEMAKGGHTGWKHKMAQGGGVRKAPFKVGDMVYSYQNPNHKMRISFVEDRGVIDGVDYGWGIKVALKTDGDGNYNPNGTYSKSSKWMSQNSVSKTKKDKYAEGGGVSKNAEYVSKRNIDKVTYNKGKDVKTVTGKNLLDGVYVSKKATTKPGKMYVELKSVGNVDFDDSSERGKNIALKKVNVTSIDEAKKVVRAFIDENDLGGGNWVGGKVFENGKNIGYIAYNGNYFEGERKFAKGGNASRNYVVRYDAEGKKAAMNTLTEAKSFVKVLKENGHTNIEILYPYNLKTVKMAQGGSTGKDKYTVSIDWELSKPRIKYGRKIFKDIYANSNKDAESIAVEQWNSVKANSNKKVLSINSINMTQLRKKPILDKPERKMTTGGDVTPIFESGVMISKPYYFFEKGFFTTEEYRIDNKFYNNVRASFVIANGIATKDQALKKANAFYEFVKSAQSKEQYDDLSEQFIIKNRKMAQGGSMGWKHKMAKGAKLKLEQQYHPSKYLTKEQWEKWNEYVKTGKIDGKKENNMFAVARWVGASVSNINGYEIEQRAKKLK
jgi:hypothetical protein